MHEKKLISLSFARLGVTKCTLESHAVQAGCTFRPIRAFIVSIADTCTEWNGQGTSIVHELSPDGNLIPRPFCVSFPGSGSRLQWE